MTITLTLEAKFAATAENVTIWNDGRAPLSWIRRLADDGTSSPATQEDIDRCSQDWRQHGPGWFICAE